jgi:hypothetical protein
VRGGTATTEAGSAGGHAAGPAIETALPLTVSIVIATYGRLIVATLPGATCQAKAALPSGNLVLARDFVIDQVADADGQAIWAYRAPVAGAGLGSGRYSITCASGGRTVDAIADFEVR